MLCTRCAVCIVQSAYLKNLALTKRTLISNQDLFNLNRFKKYRNSSLIRYKLGLYVFETYFLGFCHFLIQSSKKHIFFFWPFTSDFADSMSIISKTTKCWVIKQNKIPTMFILVKRYLKRTASKIVFVGVLILIFSKTSSPFSWKVWKYHKIWHSFIHKSIMSGLWTNLE